MKEMFGTRLACEGVHEICGWLVFGCAELFIASNLRRTPDLSFESVQLVRLSDNLID